MNQHNEHEENILLSALIDGELAVSEKSRVESHLALCKECREEVESLRFMKSVLAAAPRRAMPPELISDIERAAETPAWRRLPQLILAPRFFMPAGALAALALVASLWVGARREKPEDFIPLEPLMSAHARYSAETLVPQGSLVSSTYSSQLTASSDAQDQEPD